MLGAQVIGKPVAGVDLSGVEGIEEREGSPPDSPGCEVLVKADANTSVRIGNSINGSNGNGFNGNGSNRSGGKKRKQQKDPRQFVGPMDHSYRVANGNVADGPPSTIPFQGNGHGAYYNDTPSPRGVAPTAEC